MNKELESLLRGIHNKIENTKSTIGEKTARIKNLQSDIVHLEDELKERLEAERMLLGVTELIVEDTDDDTLERLREPVDREVT